MRIDMKSDRMQKLLKGKNLLALVIPLLLSACFLNAPVNRSEPVMEKAEVSHKQNLPKTLAALVPDGWKLYEGIQEYKAENLWEKINGNAELFLSYNVNKLTYASLVRTSDTGQYIDLFLYDMNSPANAFGVFSVERFSEEPPLDLGREAYRSDASYFIWQDRYYIQILASESTDELRQIGMNLAQEIIGAIKDSGEPIWGLSVLSRENLVPASVKYFLVDAMGLAFMRNTFTADYRKGNLLIKVFLSRHGSSESARTAVKRYTEYAADYGDGAEPLTRENISMFSCDMGGQYDVIFQKDLLVGGVLAVKDKNIAAASAADFWKQL